MNPNGTIVTLLTKALAGLTDNDLRKLSQALTIKNAESGVGADPAWRALRENVLAARETREEK